MSFKNLKIENSSYTNKIDFDGMLKGSGTLKLIGENNKVTGGAGSSLNCNIRIQGNDNVVEFGRECNIRGQILVKGKGQKVIIGDFTTFKNVYLLCQEGSNIIIGKHCMFSRDIEVRTTDAHSVVDINTGYRLNTPSSITIGNHVWVGLRVLINKGTVINDDCIVGAGSFVNKIFTEKNILIAGFPAKIIKRNITWNISRREKYTQEELDFWKNDLL